MKTFCLLAFAGYTAATPTVSRGITAAMLEDSSARCAPFLAKFQVVHLRVDLGVRVEVAATEVRGRAIFRFLGVGRAKGALRPAGTVCQVVAPAAALVVDVPFVGSAARPWLVVVERRCAIQAGRVVRSGECVLEPVAGRGAGGVRLRGNPLVPGVIPPGQSAQQRDHV